MKDLLKIIIRTLESMLLTVVLVCVMFGSIKISSGLITNLCLTRFSGEFFDNLIMTILQMVVMAICAFMCIAILFGIYKMWKDLLVKRKH